MVGLERALLPDISHLSEQLVSQKQDLPARLDAKKCSAQTLDHPPQF
jgi:hypothetical protein